MSTEPKWKRAQYGGGSSMQLFNALTIDVWPEGLVRLPPGAPNWHVSVFGLKLKTLSPDEASAKLRAITFARTVAQTLHEKATAELLKLKPEKADD